MKITGFGCRQLIDIAVIQRPAAVVDDNDLVSGMLASVTICSRQLTPQGRSQGGGRGGRSPPRPIAFRGGANMKNYVLYVL